VAEAPDISIVIPNWNGRELVSGCVESIERTRGSLRLEVIVVDNASSDGSVDYLRTRFPDLRLLVNESNQGFSRACNRGAASAAAPSICLLNSDAILQHEGLQRLLARLESSPRAGIVGAQLRNPNGSFQASHAPFPGLGLELMIVSGLGRLLHGPTYPWRGAEEERGAQQVDWIAGACMLVRREAWEAMSGLDEGYFMYSEEMDLCYRLRRAGWQVWYEPAALVTHIGGASTVRLGERSQAILYASRVRFYRLHYGTAPALAARWLILVATAVKIGAHGVLRALSGGRRGRAVVSLRQLRAELRGA